jgi:hypothetical protein
MSAYPVISKVIIDTLQHSNHLEFMFGDYLLPAPKGIYLKGAARPFLDIGSPHYVKAQGPDGEQFFPVERVKDITGPVFDSKGNIVLHTKPNTHLADQPTVPVIAISVVHMLCDLLVSNHLITNKKSPISFEEQMNKYLLPMHVGNTVLIDDIYASLYELRLSVTAALGTDPWIVHFIKIRGVDLIIEKSLDYRILSWENEHGTAFRLNHGMIKKVKPKSTFVSLPPALTVAAPAHVPSNVCREPFVSKRPQQLSLRKQRFQEWDWNDQPK